MQTFAAFFMTISLSLVALGTPKIQAAQEAPLTNKDVVDLLDVGISPDVVVAKIKTSKCEFDTSPDALRQLKSAEVPDAVLLAMIEASTPARGKSGDVQNSRSAGPRRPIVEVGGEAELKGVKSVFVYCGPDNDACENITKEVRSKLADVKLAPSPEEAEAILLYGSDTGYFLSGLHTRTHTGAASATTTLSPDGRNASTTINPRSSTSNTTPLYRKVSYGSGAVIKVMGDGRYRVLMSFDDSRKTVFERRPSTNFAREFIKAYRRANGFN
jgi:hypothetical protein